MKLKIAALLPLTLTILLAACGEGNTAGEEPASKEEHAESPAGHQEGLIELTAQQISSAGIELVSPTIGGSAGAMELPATIDGDPQATQVVSAAIGGRVVSLTRNLGQSIGRGETLAVIESREAAQLKGEIEAAQARLSLAESNYARERRLFAERVSPEQDLIAARTAATEARIALRLARQQLSAAGAGGGGLNRIGITAPISGQVIARSATLGQTVAADAELFRIANLGEVALNLALQPADAGRVKPGASVTVTAQGRQATARISFVSPALDADTRLVPALARLDNKAGSWRVGEPVTALIQLSDANGKSGDTTVRVPSTAVQSVEGKTVVFVRIAKGFQATPVTLGNQDGNMVIVTKGLTGRERIAAQNSFTLKSALGASEAGHED